MSSLLSAVWLGVVPVGKCQGSRRGSEWGHRQGVSCPTTSELAVATTAAVPVVVGELHVRTKESGGACICHSLIARGRGKFITRVRVFLCFLCGERSWSSLMVYTEVSVEKDLDATGLNRTSTFVLFLSTTAAAVLGFYLSICIHTE